MVVAVQFNPGKVNKNALLAQYAVIDFQVPQNALECPEFEGFIPVGCQRAVM